MKNVFIALFVGLLCRDVRGDFQQRLASMPPVARGTTLTKLPASLLPSTKRIASETVQQNDDPAKRKSCWALANEESKSPNAKSPAFRAFKVLIHLLANDTFPASVQQNPEKIATRALSMLQTAFRLSSGRMVDWQLFISIWNCAVDKKGRTIVMKLVRQGLVTSVGQIGSGKFQTQDLGRLKDIDQNNLLHLAAMSGSLNIVRWVSNVMSNGALKAMQEKNVANLTVRDIAAKHGREDIVDFLQRQYRMLDLEAEVEKDIDEMLMANGPNRNKPLVAEATIQDGENAPIVSVTDLPMPPAPSAVAIPASNVSAPVSHHRDAAGTPTDEGNVVSAPPPPLPVAISSRESPITAHTGGAAVVRSPSEITVTSKDETTPALSDSTAPAAGQDGAAVDDGHAPAATDDDVQAATDDDAVAATDDDVVAATDDDVLAATDDDVLAATDDDVVAATD
eukprot:Lankesteria_metandrocarpae@DN4166_c0_g1_i8.p1